MLQLISKTQPTLFQKWIRQLQIPATDLKRGMIIKHKEKYWEVTGMSIHNSGRGGAICKAELRQLGNNTKGNERFTANAKADGKQ